MPSDRKHYAETLPGDASSLPEETGPVPVQPEPGSNRKPLLLMGFFHRVSLHLTAIIILSGLVLTGAVTLRFRTILYAEEFRSAFTVYTAASNYIAAHLTSHKGRLVPRSLDHVFSKRFMHSEESGHRVHNVITHRPARVIIYTPEGDLSYVYDGGGVHGPPPAALTADEQPDDIIYWYDAAVQTIHIRGNIFIKGKLLARVEVVFPSLIHAKLNRLYRQLAGLALIILVLALGITLLFVRRELAPVRELTQAAHAAHQGDFTKRAPVRVDDEIGELATTFNEMIASVSRQLALTEALQGAVLQLGRQLKREQLFQTLVEQTVALAGTTSCRIYTASPNGGGLTYYEESKRARLPPPEEDRMAQAAYDERWAQYGDAAGGEVGEAFAVQAAIPVLSGGHRIGVMRVGPRDDHAPYDRETLSTLHTLAQFAAVALENARLYEELGEHQRIEQEMRLGRHIQQSMLPERSPVLAGYDLYGRSVPANEVGGDYFDFIESHDGSWHIVLADVSGKGVPAALIMSTVRSLMHTYLEFKSSPQVVLRLVNGSLTPDLEDDMFVTMATLCVETASPRVVFSRAGHEPLLLRRASGHVERIAPPGPALGLLDRARFDELLQEEALTLGPGDTLLLYTDGVTEARNLEDEEFGPERLDALLASHGHLSAQALYEHLVEAVSDFAQGMPRLDDITLVILKRTIA